MANRPHVALLVETSHGYGRAVLQGIMQYVRAHGPWSLYCQPRGLHERPPDWLKAWQGDGIVARIEERAMAEAIAQTGLPAVNLRVRFTDKWMPHVGMNNRAVGGLAFEHLSERGFQHFACCGITPGLYFWMDEREVSFAESVQKGGGTYSRFAGHERRRRKPSWEQERNEIAAWLTSLPKPVGLLTCSDERGLEVLEACRYAGILVPDEVAVIGVGNDEFLCTLSDPPMSSISSNAQRIGFEAAALLDRLMAGGRAPRHGLEIPPGGVVARQSTDVVATADRELAVAIRYIRERACDGLRLKTLFNWCTLSQRELERRMLKFLGRSPKEEIMRVQIERAKQLLTETDLPAAAIAEKCGFAQAKYFNRVFHTKVGLPPGEYRRSKFEAV